MNRCTLFAFSASLILLAACGDGKKEESAAPPDGEDPAKSAAGEVEQRVPGIVPAPAPAETEKFDLAEIELQPADDIRIVWLKEGQSRVVGRVKAPFHYVCDGLQGAQFSRVHGQSSPTCDIRVSKSGYLYVLKGEDDDLAKTGLTWEERPRDLKGAWLDDVHRTLVKAGDELQMSWFEAGFIAGEIKLKRWLPKVNKDPA